MIKLLIIIVSVIVFSSLTYADSSNKLGLLSAYGDFDNDKIVDFFMINNNNGENETNILSVWRNRGKNKAIEIFPNSIVNVDSNMGDIVQVIPQDFNMDGKLDVLIVQRNNNNYSNHHHFISLYLADENFGLKDSQWNIPASTDQLLAMHANNDGFVDLYGTFYESGKRGFWINKINGTGFLPLLHSDLISSSSSLPSALTYVNLPLTSPNSNAFVDMNGDCSPDLVTTALFPNSTIVLQIFIRDDRGNFNLIRQSQMNSFYTIGQLSFADLDRDGTIDVLFPIVNNNFNYYNNNNASNFQMGVMYNNQRRLCKSNAASFSYLFSNNNINSGGGGGGGEKNCLKPTNLCLADNNFNLDAIVVYPLTLSSQGYFDSQTKFILQSSSASLSFPFIPHSFRLGDWDMNEYLDILITLDVITLENNNNNKNNNNNNNNNKNNRTSTFAALLSTTPVDKERNSFVLKHVFDSVEGAMLASFLDIAEEGYNSIVVSGIINNNDNDGNNYFLTVLPNNNWVNGKNGDAFTLKSLVLNGVCAAFCPTAPEFPKPKPYGAAGIGSTVKFTVTKLDGTKHLRVGSQLCQSSYFSLQTPYQLFGTGRTNNYIEDFFVGINVNNNSYYWNALIPNSHVIITPYPLDKPSQWNMELYLPVSFQLIGVFVSFVCSLLFFSIVVIYLARHERIEDEKERKSMAHLFSFDAL